MLAKSVIQNIDKQVRRTGLSNLFYKSNSLQNECFAVKPYLPQLTFQNHFTHILNDWLERQHMLDPLTECDNYLKERQSGIGIACKTFMDIFRVNKTRACIILSEYPVFKQTPKHVIADNFQNLKNAGLSLPVIQSNMLLLADNNKELADKIEIVKSLVCNVNYGLPLLYHEKSNLDYFVQTHQLNSIKNKIEHFQQELQVGIEELLHLISKYLYYFTFHPEETVKKIKLFLDYKVSIKVLLNYDWPLYHNYEMMKTRIETCSTAGFLQLRPWVLNCNKKDFERKTKFVRHNLKKDSLCNYLSEKSGYNVRLIQFRFTSAKISKTSFLPEVNEIIDIILKEGYEYHDIIWSIGLFNLSQNEIVNRISTLKSFGIRPPFLDFLCLTNENFVNYVNNRKQ